VHAFIIRYRLFDNTYPTSKQADITLFTNYDYKSDILSATNNVLPLQALH